MEFKELLNFIDFVKTPELFEAQLTTLREEQQRLQENIEATAKIGEIAALHAQAQEAAAKAQTVINQANEQAAIILDTAKSAYDQKIAELEVRMQVLAESEKATTQALNDANAQELSAKTLSKSLQDAQGAVILERQALAAAQAEVAARLEKLKSVMG